MNAPEHAAQRASAPQPLPFADSASVQYHLSELAITRNLADTRRRVPALRPGETSVLDVGCGIGQTLLAPELESATLRCGIDIDTKAIAYGSACFPALTLRVAPAEKVPFDSGVFDLALSRVALPYTNVPEALAEMHRVLRPGGRIWVLLHSWRMERQRLWDSTKHMLKAPKDFIDRLYVASNSFALHALSRSFARPWSGAHESVQTSAGIARTLRRNGFTEIKIDRGRHFLVEARKR